MQSESALPDGWVERIWAIMRASYGAEFDRQWQCPEGVEPSRHVQEMKWHWGRELRGFQQSPNAIQFALDNLPERPPNLIQFKALCTRRPEVRRQALPSPKADPAMVEEIMSRLQRPEGYDPKAWAYNLREREEAGEKLGVVQRRFWRDAIDPLEEILRSVA